MQQAKNILKSVFGYDQFRCLQEQVIASALDGKDTLAIMPTGSGKSLCYQIPGLIFEGLSIVVSPLISLMQDQVRQLEELGIEAVMLNSSLGASDYAANVQKLKSAEAKFLYLAPETLLKESMIDLLQSLTVSAFVIDEAHCISHWGHDFRPEYRKILSVKKLFPQAVCIALTATATQRVREDIQDSLGFSQSQTFVSSFDRTNLMLKVIDKHKPFDQLLKILCEYPQESGIIYCFSRKQVEELTAKLQGKGISAEAYHAGMGEKARKGNQEAFIRDDTRIIVATVAFGMGINKPNVRFVVHYDLPKNVESYYQEIGRAGRDGLDAECVLLFGYGDIHKVRFLIDQKQGQEQIVASNQLNTLVNLLSTHQCRRKGLLAYFGESYSKENCQMCDICLAGPQNFEDLTVPAQKLLSCAKRTGEIFGLTHLIDVLRGSKAQKVLEQGHQHVSTYGIGVEYTKKQWTSLAQQLIAQGFARKDETYGSIKLTAPSYALFRGEQEFQGVLPEFKAEKEKPKPSKKNAFSGEYDAQVFDQLRALRKELADRQNVPPYMIFSDRSLMEMAEKLPQDEQSLLEVHGVGEQKLKRYAKPFLEILMKF